MKFRKSARRDVPEVNLIAFIDVLLVILIFLMISTTFSKFSALKLTLPIASPSPALAQPKTVSIAIDAGDNAPRKRDAERELNVDVGERGHGGMAR